MESVRYLLLILMIVNGIHSQQDAMGDMTQSWKNKQEYDINEMKDAIRNMSSLIQEMKNNIEKQRDDFSKIKDTEKDLSDLKGKIEVVHKNFTRTLNFICKEPGSLCTPKFYVLSTDAASFIDASTKCKNKNMTFASIRNEEEFEALYGYLKSVTVTGSGIRLSGTRINAGSMFYWNPSGQLVTNEKWWPTYPINSEQNNCIFVQLFTDNNTIKFHTSDCTSAQKYVCEYKK